MTSVVQKAIAEVAKDWCLGDREAHGIADVLFHDYDAGGYEGYAVTVFRGIDGKLYEVYGSHCSCHGLDDQWAPEETTVEAMRLWDWDKTFRMHDDKAKITAFKQFIMGDGDGRPQQEECSDAD